MPYPKDVRLFCEFYRKLREIEKMEIHPQIHRIHFEDLIYKYDVTLKRIYDILEIDLNQKKVSTKFDPAHSIYNTQLFLKDKKYEQECIYIEQHLGEFLYNFPYKLNHEGKSVF